MSIIKGPFKFTGSMAGYSYYTVSGSDKVIVRFKGGPKPEKMKTHKRFAKVRLHQQEFAGATKFSQGIKFGLGETYRLHDFNVFAKWCGMGKSIIGLDTENALGERPLMLSSYRSELENYSLNVAYPFNSVLRVTPQFEINKEAFQATVKIPVINSKMDVLNVQKLPYFRLIMSLGIVSDVIYKTVIEVNREVRKYVPDLGYTNGYSQSYTTDWFSTDDLINEQTLAVTLNRTDIEVNPADLTFLLGVGIEFGQVGVGSKTFPVKRACCGKILAVR